MEYSHLIAVTGLPGLFEMITSKSDGAIVKSLEDGSTKFISSRIHQFSHLESIEIYTTGENVNLIDVLKAMQASSEPIPADKDAAAVKAYLLSVFPNIDASRVYVSDMKKMIKWYNILKTNEVELKLSSEGAENEEETEVIEAPAETVASTEEVAPQTDLFGDDVSTATAPKKAPKKAKAE